MTPRLFKTAAPELGLAQARLGFAALFLAAEFATARVTLADWVTVVYLVYSLAAVVILSRNPRSRMLSGLLGVDLVTAAVLTIVGHSQVVHFFPLYVLVTVAYRRGVAQTIFSGVVLAAALALDSYPPVESAFGVGMMNHTFVLGGYTLVVAVLVGHTAARERGARGESAAIGLLFEHVRLDAGPVVSTRNVLTAFGEIFRAREVLLAVDNTGDDASALWRSRPRTPGEARGPIVERLSPTDHARYWFPILGSASACLLSRTSSGRLRTTAAIGESGESVALPHGCVQGFAEAHGAAQVVVLPLLVVGAFRLRLFVLDPHLDRPLEQLRLLHTMARRMAPVIHNLYLERRLRTRLQENERARLARELHDGVIQSLIGIEMRLEVARRQIATAPSRAEADLHETQLQLREQVVDVRTLMNQLRPPDVDRTRLMDVLCESAERFRRTTGIETQFDRSVDHLRLPKRVCRELVRVVDEALMNVRKHSGARRVAVRVGAGEGDVTVSIEDDGRGFGFAGRMTQPDLDAQGLGPLVIKERVQSIGGRVAIDSRPGCGSRLEVQVPTAMLG